MKPSDLTTLFESRVEHMRRLYAPASSERDALLIDDYLIASEGRFRVYYGPFNPNPMPAARVVLVGLTPGLSQLQAAATMHREASPALREDGEAFGALLRARVAFAGSMRTNLCAMLDDLGLPAAVGIARTSELFETGRHLAATISALRYPVFKWPQRTNFSGWSRKKPLASSPLFRTMIELLLGPMLAQMPGALIIPFGGSAESAATYLAERGAIDSGRIVRGFPHPSGSNGWRKRLFEANREEMSSAIISWSARR